MPSTESAMSAVNTVIPMAAPICWSMFIEPPATPRSSSPVAVVAALATVGRM